jgi:RNA recognition motif-containing protein
MGSRVSETTMRMTGTLFVSNPDYKDPEKSLESVFEKTGQVESVKSIKDIATGRSRGF